jgi:phosphomannomutase
MVTASHNGREYNGLKVSGKQALPIAYHNGLADLEKMIEKPIIKKNKRGKKIEFDKKSEYYSFLEKYIPQNIEDLNISIDCSHGVASLFVKDLLKNKANIFNDDLDGNFPNHEANPLEEKNLKQIKEAIIANNSDFGFIFDGDADRVMVLDEKAQFIPPDLLIGIMGKFFIKDPKKKYTVLQDIRSSKAIVEYLSKFGNIEMHTWRVGRAFAAPKLKEIDGLWGGEYAGHYYFKDMYYSDSGIMAMLIILDIFNTEIKAGRKVSKLIDEIKIYHNSGEVNFRIEDKKSAMQAVIMEISKINKPTKTFDFDGFRLEFEDWWFNIRPSNTEPYLRLLVEAKTQYLLTEKLSKIKSILKGFE